MKHRLGAITLVQLILLVCILGGCAPQVQDDRSAQGKATITRSGSGPSTQSVHPAPQSPAGAMYSDAQTQPADVGRIADEPTAWPVVYVLTHTGDGKKVGCGAVVGNGTLVVTAYHLVHEESVIGAHHMKGMVTVISPYLGDVRIARVIAADRELDLAVLAVPWEGHPAYKLASADETASTAGVAVSSPVPLEQQDVPAAAVRHEELQLDSVILRHGLISQLALADPVRIEEGWSGSPVLSMRSGHLLGCLTSVRGDRLRLRYSGTAQPNPRGRRQALAAASPALVQILTEDGRNTLTKHAARSNRPDDASLAMGNLCRAIRARAADTNLSVATGNLKEFLKLRPNSDAAQVMLASWTEAAGDLAAAEAICRAAVERTPGSPEVRATYAQCIANQGRLAESLHQYDLIGNAQTDDGGQVDCLVAQALLEMGRADMAAQRASQALERYPQNARLYCCRGLARLSQGKRNEAVADMESAVSLWPDSANLRYALAKVLQQARRFDDAAAHLRDAVELEPNDAQYRVELADVLLRQSPQNRTEAITILEQACGLAAPPELSQRVVRMLDMLHKP